MIFFKTALTMVGLTAGILLTGVSHAADEAAATKYGFVDMQKALQSVESGKKAKVQLEKDFNAKKKDLQNEETAIRKMDEEFRKQSLVMSDEARAKKGSELQERVMKFQQQTQKAQSEIQQKEQALTAPLVVKLKNIIAEQAKAKGYAAIFEKNENVVLYSNDKDDLTSAVVELFNKQNK